MMLKPQLRQQVIGKCKEIPQKLQQQVSLKVLANLAPLLKDVKKVGVYIAIDWELNLGPTIDYLLREQVQVYKPIAFKDNKQLRFDCYDHFASAIFYNHDYQFSAEIKWYNLDLILVPVVAVDYSGRRLGRGGGYYDTTLQKKGQVAKYPILCGVGYQKQIIDEQFADTWDISLDCFASEDGLIKFK